MENVEKIFDSFQSKVKEHALESGLGKVEELNKIRQENEALELKTMILDQQLRTLQASLTFVQNLQNCSPEIKEKQDYTLGKNVEVFKEVFSDIIDTIEGDIGNLISKDVVDENNNTDFKRKKSKNLKKGKEQVKVETRLTRSMRKRLGGSLVNPRKFYPCLICGEKKHMDYSKGMLRIHYRDSHGYNLGSGSLPVTRSQLEEEQDTKEPQNSTKCHICNTTFKDLDTLFLHKSLHINPKFCQYKCSYENCFEAFVLKEQLQNHEKVYHHNLDTN